MAVKYSEEFKQQAVQKILNRGEGVTIEQVILPLGVSMASISRWTTEFRRLGQIDNKREIMTKKQNEKRPEDWSKAERFKAIVACEGFSDSEVSAYCRQQGIYAHHIEQWKLDFLGNDSASSPVQTQQKVRQLTQQNHKLKRDLIRKDKALAETAALLVLQKKVQDMWPEDEDS